MSSAPRKAKKKKQAKAEPVKKKEPEIVTCKLADNDYTGIIREGNLGSQYLDCQNAKYTWHSGIKYEGPFNMSQIEGKGKFEWQDGSTYTGELHEGKRHGSGIYISKDGVTKYEGQWFMGKRHGEGKLIYNADASSFYEGAWKEGKKHGEGKQVWPSGNSYSGQWEDGQMRGQGTMTWYNQGQVETYNGNWEDSQPHGEGTHTWLAPEPKPDQAFKDTTSQQLNNRYKGQWLNGSRHGKGTFYYANGAYYSGEWQDHVKHGKGRHVFEDGRIYDGPFENDCMTEFKAPETAGLNFGNDDNPVRRMIDISDIMMFACPYDNRGHDADPSASTYMEPKKVLREVYNMLLRSLGDLKELYYRYRVLLPVPGEDPFVLSAHQFWLFARDCGLISPTCMVHRLDRHMFSGPRHHIEVAPEDADEVRPLTPRPPEQRRASAVAERTGGDEDDEEEDGDDESAQASDQSVSSSGAGSPSNRDAESQRRCANLATDRAPSADVGPLPVEALAATCTCGNEFVDDTLFCNKCGAKRLPADQEAIAKTLSEHHSGGGPRIHRFKREEPHVSNIHNPQGHLLFRQFVDGIVRVALARYPCEKSMEIQTQKLFKDKIIPHLEALRNGERQPSSEKAFDFVSDPEFMKVMGEFRPKLLRLFRGAIVAVADEDPNAPAAHHVNASHCPAGKIARIRHYGDFGAPHRAYHVCARLDKTIRVKDALRLFNAIGFLRGLKRGEVPWADLSKQVFSYAGDEDLLVIDEQEKEALIAAQESGSTTPSESDMGARSLPGLSAGGASGGFGGGSMGGFGGGGMGGGMGGFGGLGASMDQGEEKRRKSDKVGGESRSRRRGKKDEDDEGSQKTKDKDEHHEGENAGKAPAPASLLDFAQCDFSVTPLQAIRMILEVVSPGSVKALYWQLDPTRVALSHEIIALLEFVETELIFTEFARLLIRMSDLGTRKEIAFCERLSPAARFEGFVRHIFFPALRDPYVPPVAVDEIEKSSDVARSNDLEQPISSARDLPEAKSGEGSAVGEEEAVETVKEEEERLETLSLWAGFDDYSCAETEGINGARRWPNGYEHEIASWM